MGLLTCCLIYFFEKRNFKMTFRLSSTLLFLIFNQRFYPNASIQQEEIDFCSDVDLLEDEMTLFCSQKNYNDSVTIIDPLGRIVVICKPNSKDSECQVIQSYQEMSIGTEDGKIMLKIPHQQGSNIEGLWSCQWGDIDHALNISYSKGSILWTDVNIHGEVVTTIAGKGISISCSTCQNPEIKVVEFSINETTVDFVRLTKEKICYHTKGKCNQQDCVCSQNGRKFTRNYNDYVSLTNVFSCAMHFRDIRLGTEFLVRSSIKLVNGDFVPLGTTKMVIGTTRVTSSGPPTSLSEQTKYSRRLGERKIKDHDYPMYRTYQTEV